MQRSKSKKRPTSNPKTTKNSLSNIIKQKNLNPYGIHHFKVKRNNNQKKLRIQHQNQKQIDTSDYEFPEFAIYSHIDSQKKGKTIESSVTQKNKSSRVMEKLEKNGPSRQHKKGQKSKCMKKKNSNKQIVSFCQEDPKKTENENKLEIEFKEGLRKIFKLLDIFGRGTISEVNINKWIPQFFLYFLGKPIQKIKSQRLTINQSEFISLCYSILKDSSPEDIKQFITQANASAHLKASITVTELDKSKSTQQDQIMSPIKRRMMKEEFLKNSQNPKKYYQNSQFNFMMQAIKIRQSQISEKIRETQKKKKSVTFNPIEEVYPNQLQGSSINPNNSKPLQESRGVQVDEFIEEKHSTPLSQLKQMSLKSSPYVQKSMISDKVSEVSRKMQVDNPMIANFTFQLPLLPDQNQENIKPKSSSIKHQLDYNQEIKKYQDYLQNIFKQKQEKTLEKTNEKPLSARQINLNREQTHPDRISQSYRLNFEQDDKRLDRLRNKIQSYMKKNAQKIEKSRSFFLENSPNQL